MTTFRSHLPARFRAGRRLHDAGRHRRPRDERGKRSSRSRGTATSRARRSPSFPSSASPATRSTICCCRTRCSTASSAAIDAYRRGIAGAAAAPPVRRAGPSPGAASTTGAVAVHRGRLLGVVPKIYLPNYREFYERAAFRLRRRHRRQRDRAFAAERGRSGRTSSSPPRTSAASSCTRRSARISGCRSRRARRPRSPARRCSPTSRRANITIGKAETRRAPLPVAVGALPCRLSLLGGGRRRIDDRPRLGRAGLDLRERHAARRDRAIPGRRPHRASPTSTSTSCARSGRGWPRSTTTAAATARRVEQFRRIVFRLDPPAGDLGLERTVERFPFVPADRRPPRARLLRGLQHPGRRPRPADGRDRRRSASSSASRAASIRRRR